MDDSSHLTGSQISFTVKPEPGESLFDLCSRLARRLQDYAATPLHLLAFGQVQASEPVMVALRRVFGHLNWPVTWVEGADCAGLPLAGIQVHAFAGDVERVSFGGRVVGSIFTEGGARQCLIGGLTPANKTLARGGQTTSALESMGKILTRAGFEFSDVIRTWFFLEDILSWYDEFNQARTKIYSGLKFRTGSLPASTGVGAKNPAGTALVMAAWAFRPLDKQCAAGEIASPLQCPAPAYGSSFSRAMEVPTNLGRRIFISGTASIAPGGKTLWVGDVRKQIELTMEVVEAILRAQRFDFSNLTRATAYFRKPADAAVFAEWLATHRLVNMPVISTQCDVCRDDLLFELEAEAETENLGW